MLGVSPRRLVRGDVVGDTIVERDGVRCRNQLRGALGVALPFAIANVIFGGTAEYVALWLKGIGHERWFYIYISGLAALSLIAYVRMRETKTNSLIEED